jgi:phage repressor protein C with HTH and peptisase S24 domain
VAKALTATGTALDTFVQLIEAPGRSAIKQAIPLLGLAQAGQDGNFDSAGLPTGHGWEEIRFPALNDEHAYALEISGDAMAPVYPEGTFVIVSPAASIRRGDRVVIKTKDNEVIVLELKRRTAKTIELCTINPPHLERTLPVRDVLWIARAIWASQ